MQFVSKARYVRFSPFKLRPYVDIIRGENLKHALNLLATIRVKRVVPIQKMLQSAAANAKHLEGIEPEDLVIKDIRVDHGPIIRYYKPGAMGRANIQKKRFSHMSIVIKSLKEKEKKD